MTAEKQIEEQQLKTNQQTTGGSFGRKVVIAVDGPAASGKGTLAKKMAERLGYAYLDTGALYRAVGYTVLEMGGNPSHIDDVQPALVIVKRNLTPELLDSAQLRTPEVSDAASRVSALTAVRQALLEFQRNFAKNPPGNVGGAILDGRDIGTVICPDADVKLFVTAALDERARRRFEELKDKGADIDFERVMYDMQQRDLRDSTRANAPTAIAEDAYILDTTNLDPQAALDEAVAAVRSKFTVITQQTA